MEFITAALCAGLVALTAFTTHAAPSFVWLEAENPDSADFEWSAGGAKKSHLLSAGRCLYRTSRETFPEAGENMTYRFDAPQKGTHQVWLRLGYPGLIPDVAWRIDDGKWFSVGTKDRVRNQKDDTRQRDVFRDPVNVKETGYWNSMAWWHLGDADLGDGAHTLHLRLINGPSSQPLLAMDAVCIVADKWIPEGTLKPGEMYDSELDRSAAAQIFELPTSTGDGGRAEIELTGLWQVARYDDPNMNVDTYKPVEALPTPDVYPLRWMGIDVPSSLWDNDETFAGHRVIYRTRVTVPAAYKGRGFKLHFSGTSWIASVFVNGQLAGTHKGVWIPWDLDVSTHIQPGQVNEIAVAIKGSWYAFDGVHSKWDIHTNRVRPLGAEGGSYWNAPIDPSTKGDDNGLHYGIVNPVTLVAAGQAYTEDVFIKPSVQNNELVTDVTIRNTSTESRSLKVVCEAVNDKTGEVEKSFGPVAVQLPAKQSTMVTVKGAWTEPKLWWPVPDPDLYRLRTRVMDGNTVIDTHEELFGFREVTVKDTGIYINGVRRNVWCWVNVGTPYGASKEEWARVFREEGNRCTRFSKNRKISQVLATREDRLEFFDRNGIAGRLCSMIDGMRISAYLGDRDRDEKGNPKFVRNEIVWENYREHIGQMTKAYRNHPSVIFYQIENELVYITGMNRFGDYLPDIEREMMDVYLAGYANDPTRPYSVGGGGDLRHARGMDRALEINSPHYPRGAVDYYPENAYTLEHYSTKITRWPWTREQPWIVGESAHASELELGSYVSGADAYKSKDDVDRAKAKFLRMMYGGYRWTGVAGFFPWDNLSKYEDGRKIFGDLIAIPRKQSWRLYGGKENRLLYKVMNDSLTADPVMFEWTYTAGGKRIAGEALELTIEPGFGEERTLLIAPPACTERVDGVLSLKVSQKSVPDFVDEVSVPVLPQVTGVKTSVSLFACDRSGRVPDYLRGAGIAFTAVEDLAAFVKSKQPGLLIIGPDTLSADEAFGSDLLKFVVRGNQVICLEQEYPPAGANLAANLRSTQHFGGYAHPQALGTPVFRDLGKEDLIDWAGDAPTFKNVYMKPTEGARSLVQCGPELPYSPLVEMPAGAGMLVLCQLRVGAKLGVDPAADILLRNMIETYAGRRPSDRKAALYAPGNRLLADKVNATGAMVQSADDLAGALDIAASQAVIVDASNENLRKLSGLRTRADAFQQAGGWIVLCNVRPDSVDAFNELMGTDHMLRLFRSERDVMENMEHPLAATLGHANVMYLSAKEQQKSRGAIWASWNTFDYPLDTGLDAAPFTLPPEADDDLFAFKPSWNDRDPYNWVNGMTREENWRYIRQIWVVKEGDTDPNGTPGPQGLTHTFRLRRPERLKQINIWNNANYSAITALDIIFDGDEAGAVSAVLPPEQGKQAVALPQSREVKQSITLKIRDWQQMPNQNENAPHLVGVGNIEFLREERRSQGVNLDKAGALSVFQKGPGGVFVSQIKFMEDEPNPKNAPKKVALLATILQNMNIGSRAAETVAVPGENIRYTTIDITDSCNRYRAKHERETGWFQRGADLATLPAGEHYFADVLYHPVDYATAPVPNCVVLAGGRDALHEATGMQVGGKKADVLFFLHAMDVRRPITENDRARMTDKKNPFLLPTVANYIIHYANGETAKIPVVMDRHVDHWLQNEPRALPEATVGWDAPIEGAEDGQRGVLYSMKASNPRPDVAIQSIDVEIAWDWYVDKTKGKIKRYDQRGTFGVLAVTLGEVIR